MAIKEAFKKNESRVERRVRGSPLTLTQEGKTMTKRGDDENETGRIERSTRRE